MRSGNYDAKPVPTLGPATLEADTDGAAVDRLGHEAVSFAIMVGAGGDTFTSTKRIDFILQDSDDGETFAPVEDKYVSGASLVTDGVVLSLAAAHAEPSATTIGYTGYKRYTRLVADFNGTHAAGTPVSAIAILGRAHRRPEGQAIV